MRLTLLMLFCFAPVSLTAQAATGPTAFRTQGAFFAVSVSNLEEARAWYSDKLGLSVTMQPPAFEGIRALIMEGGGLTVELVHNPAAQAARALANPTLEHGPFKVGVVVDDLNALLERLRARGATIAFGPFPARDGQRANVGVRDNSGTLIQFFGR